MNLGLLDCESDAPDACRPGRRPIQALAAAVRVAYGRRARPILPIAEAASGFFGTAVGVLVVLLVGARAFTPAGVLVAVFAWPLWLLFSERCERRRKTLAIGAGTILIGLLGERFLLVLPSLDISGGVFSWLVGAGVVVGVAGLFLLSVGSRLASLEAGAG